MNVLENPYATTEHDEEEIKNEHCHVNDYEKFVYVLLVSMSPGLSRQHENTNFH